MKYAKIVEWDDEEQCYVGSIPALNTGGCCKGSDQRAIFEELCEIEKGWLGTGDDLPPHNTHPPLHEFITDYCAKVNDEIYRQRKRREKAGAADHTNAHSQIVIG